ECDVWSSLRMPPGVACAYIAEPSNAAMFAAKILAPHDPQVAANIAREQAAQRQRVIAADSETRHV
ncbi:MAG: AIR carboxylase family protein, partial [Actinomycetota bacterium]